CPAIEIIYFLLLHLLWSGMSVVICDQDEQQCKQTPGSLSLPVLQRIGDVTLGGLFPLHETVVEPHHQQSFDTLISKDMIFAIEEINREGKLLPNVTLGYKIYDSCQTEPLSLNVTHLHFSIQILRDCDVYFTHFSSQVSYFSSCACLSNKKEYPAFLRTMPSDLFQVDALVQLVKHFQWTWVGVIAGDDVYGRSGAAVFANEKFGACVALQEIIPKNHAREALAAIVSRIRSSGALVVLVFAVEQDAGALFDEALRHEASQGLTGIQWLASEAWSTAPVLSTPPKYHQILQGTIGLAVRGVYIPGLQDFLLRLHPSNPDASENPFLIPFWEKVFGCRLGANSGNQIVNDKPLCSGSEDLRSMKNIYSDFSKLRISYNVYKAVYAIAHAIKSMMSCKKDAGPFPLKACPDATNIQPWQVGYCTDSHAGEISNQTKCVLCLPQFWSNVERTACFPKEVDFLSFSDTMGITLITIALLGSLCTCWVIFIFSCHISSPIVRANNSELSFLLLFSLTLCFLCSLTFIGRPSDWSCMLRQTAFGITFVLCISCVLGKTIVVLMAFRATLPGSNLMKWFGPVQQRAFITLSTLVQVIICIIWLTVAPPTPQKLMPRESAIVILLCDEGSALGFALVLGYIGLLACLCLFLAFLARKLPDNFNEAKYITFSMLIFCAVWVAFIPAYISSPGKYAVAVEIFAILASSYGLLACIFAPKCYIILLKPEKNSRKHLMSKTSVQ
uniref:Extracellular calcium-sensing receptor-like n=1 Tax=Gadus morhua TaxID=8049 RepID=A0A8C5BBW0_GADMO